jgi:hypothetical protein
MQCTAHDPLYVTRERASASKSRRPHAARDVRQMRRGLVLVLSSARLLARRSANWAFRHELSGVSARDELQVA